MEATSKAVRTTGRSEGLLLLKRQFEHWRAGRRLGERIPSELWAGAVAAAVEHGAYRVAAELRLDYAVRLSYIALWRLRASPACPR